MRSSNSNRWLARPPVPLAAAAILAALHLREPSAGLLAALGERQWRDALDFADRAQLTLTLRERCGDLLAPHVRERLNRNFDGNSQRRARIDTVYREVAHALDSHGVPFLALKGVAHCPDFVARPELRVQYDIDLYVPPQSIAQARDAVLALGYEPLAEMESFPTDHLPALIRKTGWEWHGDYFDPAIPTAIELHFRFWNGELEGLPLPSIPEFWERRIRRCIAGIPMHALAPADALAYASLHFVRHVLHGSARPFHAYEIACFLQSRKRDQAFWSDWTVLHAVPLRRLQAVAFCFAASWFGCALSGAAQEEIAGLPKASRVWFDDFAESPVAGLFAPAKQELWLHLSLLESAADARRILRRRLLPAQFPGPVDAVYLPAERMTLGRRVLRQARYAAYLLSRLRHHAIALPGVLVSGVRWWWKVASSRKSVTAEP